MARKKLASCSFKLLLLTSLITWSTVLSLDSSPGNHSEELRIGGIVDLTTHIGKEERAAMQVAIEDVFSDVDPLLVKDSRGDPTRAVSSAKNLIKKNHVAAIVGLRTWPETFFVAEVGNKSKVPIISLSNEVPSWSDSNRPFLVNAARGQFAQMKAVADIISSWKWRKVNVIYEDINSAVSSIVPYLISALQDAGAEISELLPLTPTLSDRSLSESLRNLKNGQCRVQIVHASAPLAAKIFRNAKRIGVMEKEFVWITTVGTMNLIDTFDASIISSMQGVLGVKSYYSRSTKQFKSFRFRFNSKFRELYPQEPFHEPCVYSLQAYDAMRAVSLALTDEFPRSKSFQNSTNNSLMLSISVEKIVSRISESNFEGLAGAFNFQKGILSPENLFRIINVVGRSYREIGYWTENLGFSESTGAGSKYTKSMRLLGQVFWPGGPWSTPRGWALPTSAEPLKIGVPVSNSHKEFVDVVYDQLGRGIVAKGFSINVFDATLKFLPYHLSYIFVPFNGTYDSLVEQVKLRNFDAVVADTAIVAERFQSGEFSQPYADPGLQMLITARTKNINRAWVFTKPFSTSLWISIGVINIYNGLVVWLIERNYEQDRNAEIRRGSLLNQIGYMLYSAFKTLFSLNVDKLSSNLSRFVMVVWLFLALVLTQSFTASLSAIFSDQWNDLATVDVETLRSTGAKIGCDGGSFVVAYLTDVLKIHPDNIVRIYSEDDYAQALVNEEIAAAYLEVPYLKVFLAKNCEGFTTSGPIYKVGGFGFVFQRSSPYLPDISEAIVKVVESGTLKDLENSLTSSYKCLASDSSDEHHRLDVSSFQGLFEISVGISTFALLLFYTYCCPIEQIEQAAGPGPGPGPGPGSPARGHEPPATELVARGPTAHEPAARGPEAHEPAARVPEPPARGPAADDNIHVNRKRSSSGSTRTSRISHRKSSHSY
ncbi:IONOTROPIC GLUTAMATE RECEPTOR [Salix purpurea]|uniref:Glutamate receptor n=1 Tax=Salix purpurea TaxID=77065 RepID=A0A9Q1AA78_SALPP|nr:IONOTROPIC GLUTAMATE RECEPTOR [Salix purpurea]